VLASKGHVYHLDNQDLPRGFVGEKVKVRGFLDPKTEIIRVVNIEAEQIRPLGNLKLRTGDFLLQWFAHGQTRVGSAVCREAN